jgi:phytoene synthase
MRIAASYEWSRTVARARARYFYYSFRLLPPSKHNAICAIYAFMRQCDDLSDEAGASRDAIEGWRRDMEAALGHRFPSHPVWPGFVDAVERFNIPRHVFHDMVDGVLSDLEPRRVQTFDELYRYCYQVASVVGLSVIHIFGFEGADAPLLAERCGVAFQLTNILRDVREDWERDRIYLPAEDLDRHGVAAMSDTASLRALLRELGSRARRYYEEAEPLVGMVDPSSRASLRALIDIYRALLDKIEQSGFAVWDQRIRVPGWRKTWLMLRAMA